MIFAAATLNYAASVAPAMETVHQEMFKFQPGRLLISGFVIDEQKMIDLFRAMREAGADDSKLADRLSSLLYLGYMADQSVRIADKVDYVKEGFESMTQDIDSKIRHDFADAVKERMEKFLGKEGSFTRELQDTFGQDGRYSKQIDGLMSDYSEQIESVLDPANESSPFHALQKNLEQRYAEIQQFMNQQQGRSEAEGRSSIKGLKFEEQVFGVLNDSAPLLGCNLENTSGKRGISGSSNAKKGDFVLTEKQTGKRIVIEAKNLSKDPSTKSILEYSRIAIENREADYCVYVYYDSDDSTVPEAGMFNEVAKNVLFVTISESDSGKAQERMVRFACSWALARVKSEEGDMGLDEKLSRLETRLRKNLDTIKTIKNNSAAITSACKNMMDDLEVDLGLKQEKTKQGKL